MIKVLVVGQTPPPFGGQAVMIERLLRGNLPGIELFHVRMAFSRTMAEMGTMRWSKLFHLLGVIAKIVYHRVVHGVRILYYPPAGPNRVPMVRDLAILLATRWMFDKTILHFHAGGLSELYPRLPRTAAVPLSPGLLLRRRGDPADPIRPRRRPAAPVPPRVHHPQRHRRPGRRAVRRVGREL